VPWLEEAALSQPGEDDAKAMVLRAWLIRISVSPGFLHVRTGAAVARKTGET